MEAGRATSSITYREWGRGRQKDWCKVFFIKVDCLFFFKIVITADQGNPNKICIPKVGIVCGIICCQFVVFAIIAVVMLSVILTIIID